MLKSIVLLELEHSWTVQRIKGAGNQNPKGMAVWLAFWWGRLEEGGNQVPLLPKTPETQKWVSPRFVFISTVHEDSEELIQVGSGWWFGPCQLAQVKNIVWRKTIFVSCGCSNLTGGDPCALWLWGAGKVALPTESWARREPASGFSALMLYNHLQANLNVLSFRWINQVFRICCFYDVQWGKSWRDFFWYPPCHLCLSPVNNVGEMVQQEGSKNLNQSCDRKQQLFHAHSPHPAKDQGLFLHLKNISLTNYIHSTGNISVFAN